MILDYIPDKKFVKEIQSNMKYDKTHISKYIVHNGFGYIFKRFNDKVRVMVVTLDHNFEEISKALSGL